MNIEKLNLDWRYPLTPITKVEKIVIHHPAHETWGAQEIHEYHKNGRGWNGAGYNYFITKDGRIQELRGRNVGAHVKGHNSNSLGISFQGNFDVEQMTDEQIEAGAWLVAMIVKDDGLTLNDVLGHRDLANTSCPGANFKMDEIIQRALEFINPNIKKEEIPPWKKAGIEYLHNKGLLDNPKYWTSHLDDKMPVWAAMLLLMRIHQDIKKGEHNE